MAEKVVCNGANQPWCSKDMGNGRICHDATPHDRDECCGPCPCTGTDNQERLVECVPVVEQPKPTQDDISQEFLMGFKVNDVVDYHAVIGGPVTSKEHTIRMFGEVCGQVVAFLTGKSGCVSLKALSKSKEV